MCCLSLHLDLSLEEILIDSARFQPIPPDSARFRPIWTDLNRFPVVSCQLVSWTVDWIRWESALMGFGLIRPILGRGQAFFRFSTHIRERGWPGGGAAWIDILDRCHFVADARQGKKWGNSWGRKREMALLAQGRVSSSAAPIFVNGWCTWIGSNRIHYDSGL